MKKHFTLMLYALTLINIVLNCFFTLMLIFKRNEYYLYNTLTGFISLTFIFLLILLLDESTWKKG